MNAIDNMYLDIIIKTVIASVLSGFIGMEREIKDRPAGFRTHILVCLGSMSVVVLSDLVVKNNYELYGAYSDPFRLAAQVISGIGFLGAGTIIHFGSNVRGLTTAASLWVVAILGLVVGSGYYFLAVTISLTIYITLVIFNIFSRKIVTTANVSEIFVDLINNPKTLGAINFIIGGYRGHIIDLKFLEDDKEDLISYNSSEEKVISIKLVIKLPDNSLRDKMIEEIEGVHGVVKAMVI